MTGLSRRTRTSGSDKVRLRLLSFQTAASLTRALGQLAVRLRTRSAKRGCGSNAWARTFEARHCMLPMRGHAEGLAAKRIVHFDQLPSFAPTSKTTVHCRCSGIKSPANACLAMPGVIVLDPFRIQLHIIIFNGACVRTESCCTRSSSARRTM